MNKIDFNTLASIKEAGFDGFLPLCELSDLKQLPDSNGVYMILLKKASKPVFLTEGTGGYFKGKNPNVSIDELEKNWINDTIVVYIGEAKKIRSRLSQCRRFGEGRKSEVHPGGRYIWQIESAMNDLIVCWKTTTESDEDEIKSNLINSFIEQYSNMPFANIVK